MGSNIGIGNEFKHGDASSAWANSNGLVIDIWNDVVKKGVRFKAFITQFQDQFDTSYDDEFFGGDAEPSKKMTQIVRKINLGWDVVSASKEEAKENMQRASALFQLIYPLRDKIPGDTPQYFPVAGGSAIFKIRFLNLIGEAGKSWSPAGLGSSGLLGYLDGLSYDVQPEFGFFREGMKVYPQNIKFSCVFYPQNIKNPPSWVRSSDGKGGVSFNLDKYPYQEKGHYSSEKGKSAGGDGGGGPEEWVKNKTNEVLKDTFGF